MGESYNLSRNGLTLDWLSFSWDPENIPDPDIEKEVQRKIKVQIACYDQIERAKTYSESKYEQFFTLFPEFNRVAIIEKRMFSHHYEKAFKIFDGIMLFADMCPESQNKGVNVSISGHAIEDALQLLNVDDPYDLIATVIKRGGKISRLDLAFDDFTKTYSSLDYQQWFLNDQIVTHFRRYEFIGSTAGGNTFNLGTRDSDKYLRIYDKYLESNGEIDSIRYEFELHGVVARKISQDLVELAEYNFKDLLFSFFRVVVESNSDKSKRGDRDTLPEWLSFVESQVSRTDVININVKKLPRTYERSRNWFVRDCGKVLAMLRIVEGDDFIDALAASGFESFSPSDKQLVEDAFAYKEKFLKEE